MSVRPRRRALLVLGMHRSGTSCVARIANLMGVEIGDNLRPPQPDNPRGFWEHAGLSELNDQVLSVLGRSWDDPNPLPRDWTRRAEIIEIGHALRALLEQELSRSPDLLVKDPRLCLVLPLWREVLGELDCEIRFLWVVRNARSVAASLARRNGLSIQQSELLWLRHNLAAELETRDEARVVLHFEDVVSDWRQAFADAPQRISLPVPEAGSDAAEAIDHFVSRDLDHSPPPDSGAEDEIAPWIGEFTRAFEISSTLDTPESEAILDRVRKEMEAADWHFASLGELARSEAHRLRERVDQEEETSRTLATEKEHLEEALRLETITRQDTEQRLQILRGVLERSADLRDELSERVDTITRQFEARAASLSEDLERRLEALSRDNEELERERRRLFAREETIRSLSERLESLEIESRERHARELEAARNALATELDRAERARVDAETHVARLKEELQDAQGQHDRTRAELAAHEEVLRRLMSSRSWRITKPLRGWRGGSARRATGTSLEETPEPTEWQELLPGKPFRQKLRSPVSDLVGLGICFFTYGRPNRSSVRVRLLEDLGAWRPARLVDEVVFAGDQIRDGESSTFALRKRISDAASRRFLLEIESLDGAPGASVSPAIGQTSYQGRILSRGKSARAAKGRLLILDFLTASASPRKAFAFVSGCPGGAYRYRCEHQAEMLRLRGYSVDVLPPDSMPWTRLLDGYQVVVVHRVPHTPEFETFVSEASRLGVHVVFDTDDLVFAPEIESQIAALDDLAPSERALWLDGVQRYRRSLLLCDKALVSTPGLKRSLEARLQTRAFISRNRASDQMVEDASKAEASSTRDDRAIRIAYLSGTPTHERDFAECLSGLRSVMEKHESTRLVLAGHIKIPEKLAKLSERIDRIPLMPWQELPELYATVDINLAPLESDNEFTEGKSELKYFEAGLLGVPTVASRVGGFVDAIRDGRNGYLCESDDDWARALDLLVEDPALRRRIGRAAHQDVKQRYTTRAAASETAETWLELLGPRSGEAPKLRIAMVVRAPIANTGGGYKKIFQIVRHLSASGHEVCVYVEPIAHLRSLSEREIDAFCRNHFECGSAEIRVGHDSISDCDVAIATNWPTAHVVAELPNARMRAYLVQDDEAEFYSADDPLRRSAAATYDLPLLIIGMGRYLADAFGKRNGMQYPWVDFALGEEFFEDRETVESKLSRLESMDAHRLLFFARPGIPRRAFDLGVAALTEFHEARPDVEIRLYGLEEPVALPFEHLDLGVIDQNQLAREMREASVHLSFSRTNASTVMFEAMASGAVAVELDRPGVRALVDDPSTCVLCEDDPRAVTNDLLDLFDDGPRMSRIALAGHASASNLTVTNMCNEFEEILLRYSLSGR